MDSQERVPFTSLKMTGLKEHLAGNPAGWSDKSFRPTRTVRINPTCWFRVRELELRERELSVWQGKSRGCKGCGTCGRRSRRLWDRRWGVRLQERRRLQSG